MTIAPADTRRTAGLFGPQIRYEQLTFWRNPQSAFFTFVFPVVIVAIFGAVFRGNGPSSFYGGLTNMQHYTPTIAALSVLGSCYSQLAVSFSARWDPKPERLGGQAIGSAACSKCAEGRNGDVQVVFDDRVTPGYDEEQCGRWQ